MRLSQAQQHAKRAAIILGQIWEAPAQDDQHAIQAAKINKAKAAGNLTPEEKEQKDVIQDLTKLKKVELQEMAITRELDFTSEETKAELIQLIEDNE